MKKSGICPKCNSKEIAADLLIPDHLDPHIKTAQKIDVATTPQNIFFKGTRGFEIRAWICLDCGFLEQYLQNPSSFGRAYREGESNKA